MIAGSQLPSAMPPKKTKSGEGINTKLALVIKSGKVGMFSCLLLMF